MLEINCLLCFYFVIKKKTKTKNKAKNHADENFWNPQEIVLNIPK